MLLVHNHQAKAIEFHPPAYNRVSPYQNVYLARSQVVEDLLFLSRFQAARQKGEPDSQAFEKFFKSEKMLLGQYFGRGGEHALPPVLGRQKHSAERDHGFTGTHIPFQQAGHRGGGLHIGEYLVYSAGLAGRKAEAQVLPERREQALLYFIRESFAHAAGLAPFYGPGQSEQQQLLIDESAPGLDQLKIVLGEMYGPGRQVAGGQPPARGQPGRQKITHAFGPGLYRLVNGFAHKSCVQAPRERIHGNDAAHMNPEGADIVIRVIFVRSQPAEEKGVFGGSGYPDSAALFQIFFQQCEYVETGIMPLKKTGLGLSVPRLYYDLENAQAARGIKIPHCLYPALYNRRGLQERRKLPFVPQPAVFPLTGEIKKQVVERLYTEAPEQLRFFRAYAFEELN